VKTQRHRDAHGRTWDIALVPVEEAAAADAAFWRRLTPEARVAAVFECTRSALMAQGKSHVVQLGVAPVGVDRGVVRER